jgi:hypothetical protein
LRIIQYKQTASLRAIATLAIFRPRRIVKWQGGFQALRRRTFLHFLLDGLRQIRDRGIQSVQQLQQIVCSPARPGR